MKVPVFHEPSRKTDQPETCHISGLAWQLMAHNKTTLMMEVAYLAAMALLYGREERATPRSGKPLS